LEKGYSEKKTECINVTFVGFSRIFLLGILIFKGLTARHLYKSFGVKGLSQGLQRVAPEPQVARGALCRGPPAVFKK
jgi:hypothetical protein